MAMLKEVQTIPELFHFLTAEYNKRDSKPAFRHRAGEVFVDVSYDKFREETETFAYGLKYLGLKRGDHIALISENRIEWAYTDMAMGLIGAVSIPIYPSLTSETIEFILKNSESKAVILSNKLQLNKYLKIKKQCKKVKAAIVLNEEDMIDEPDLYSFRMVKELGVKYRDLGEFNLHDTMLLTQPDDVASIIYTSGTTGNPKGVVLTHRNIFSNVKDANESLPIFEDDVFLSFLPLCHIFERMAGYYTMLAAGVTVCYARSIESVAQDMLDIKPTLITAVPRLFERMYSKIMKNLDGQPESKQKIFNWGLEVGREFNEARKAGNVPVSLAVKHKLADKLVFSKIKAKTGGRLRFFVSGSAALSRELAEFFESVGILIVEGYGLTEASPVITCNNPDNYKFGTVGTPFPSVEVKIAPDGEILARGPNIMQGYYKNKKETDAVLKDGWLHTGDIGVFDADGYLMITDRKKHLFKTTGGKYIAPTPIENMFLSSKYIDQFVLIGDRRMFLSALIVPDYEAVKEYADSHNIPYKSEDDLVQNETIVKFMEKELVKFQKNLANYERVRKFALLDHPLTLENGEVTPSLKIKRKVVEQRYSHLIEQMYDDITG